jgi:hypothetical protein
VEVRGGGARPDLCVMMTPLCCARHGLHAAAQESVRQGHLAGEAATHAANTAARDRALREAAAALALPPPLPAPGAASKRPRRAGAAVQALQL